MSILCNLQNINLAFGEKVIFKDAKLTISNGDKIGLIGLNGQGKSTLLNILSERLIPDKSVPPFIFDKNNDSFVLFYIPQELTIEGFEDLSISDFYLSFYPELLNFFRQLQTVEKKLIEDYTDEKLLNKQQQLLDQFQELGGWDIQNRYLNYLKTFEFHTLNADIKNLSGGELKKIALSIGLSSTANLVLWDEPTNHLDIDTIEKLEDEFLTTNKTFILISHDRYLLNNVTTRIIQIDQGKINSFTGNYYQYLEFLEEKQKELEKNLDKLKNKERRELAWLRQGVKARGTRSKKRVEGYHDLKSQIQSLKDLSKKSVDLSLAHSGRKSKLLISIEDGFFSYKDKPIFENLNLSISFNDKIALIGPNGVGKSTLIKIFAKQLSLTEGRMNQVDGLKLVIFDQKRESLIDEMSILEFIGEGVDFVHLPDGTKKHIASYLESFLFKGQQIYSPISTLSGGEKNRLQLAKFMAQSADLWIFDEPTNDLDLETLEILERELKSYKAPLIIIGHDRAFLDNTCNKTWLIHEKMIEEFIGGYSSALPYLDALNLEKELKLKEKNTIVKAQENTESKAKGNKYTIEKLEADIESIELKISKLEKKLESLDYNLNEKEFLDLTQQIDQHKDQLNTYYKNWEDINS